MFVSLRTPKCECRPGRPAGWLVGAGVGTAVGARVATTTRLLRRVRVATGVGTDVGAICRIVCENECRRLDVRRGGKLLPPPRMVDRGVVRDQPIYTSNVIIENAPSARVICFVSGCLLCSSEFFSCFCLLSCLVTLGRRR